MNEHKITKLATEWIARLDRGGDSQASREEFERWLEEDRRHVGAFVRAEAAWRMLDRVQVLRDHSAREQAAANPTSRRALIFGGVALGGAAAAASLAFISIGMARTVVFQAGSARPQSVRLQDGSVAVLGADSAIAVTMDRRARRVVLRAGEAWFQVAKDRSRPFTVEAAGTSVRAVGTAFSVRRESKGARVLVTEGTVEASALRAATPTMKLQAGSQAYVDRTGPIRVRQISTADIARELAWKDGKIALNGETLSDAVAVFNRYNERKILIETPELESERLVGWFSLDHPDEFSQAIAQTFGAGVASRDGNIVLSLRSCDGSNRSVRMAAERQRSGCHQSASNERTGHAP